MKFLDSVYVVRYEDFVNEPQEIIEKIYEYLGLKPLSIQHKVLKNMNEKY